MLLTTLASEQRSFDKKVHDSHVARTVLQAQERFAALGGMSDPKSWTFLFSSSSSETADSHLELPPASILLPGPLKGFHWETDRAYALQAIEEGLGFGSYNRYTIFDQVRRQRARTDSRTLPSGEPRAVLR